MAILKNSKKNKESKSFQIFIQEDIMRDGCSKEFLYQYFSQYPSELAKANINLLSSELEKVKMDKNIKDHSLEVKKIIDPWLASIPTEVQRSEMQAISNFKEPNVSLDFNLKGGYRR